MDIFIVCNSQNLIDIRKNPFFKMDLGKALISKKNPSNPQYEIPDQINLYGNLTNRILHKEGIYKGYNIYSDILLPLDDILFMNDEEKWEGKIGNDILNKIDTFIEKIKLEIK